MKNEIVKILCFITIFCHIPVFVATKISIRLKVSISEKYSLCYDNIVFFPVEAEYSYFSADFGLKIFL